MDYLFDFYVFFFFSLVSLEDLVFRILKNEDDKVAIRDFFSVSKTNFNEIAL